MTQPSPNPLLEALDGRRILAIDGPNFSGRTDLLRRFCRAAADGRVYLGPEVYFALSGLTTSMRQEIELHAGTSVENSRAAGAIEALDIASLLDHHPAKLSGGEQACLTVACGMALKPAHLAIDCALEQLDHHRLQTTLQILQGTDGPSQCAIVTDNRLNEWPAGLAPVDIATLRRSNPRPPPTPPINPDSIVNADSVKAPAIEIRNLSAGYKGRENVLHDLSLALAPGKIYTLQGANGAGKSTFAKILCGVLRPTTGDILFDGNTARPWKTPGKTVAYHLQNPDVGLFESTVAQEMNDARNPARAKVVMEAFGLSAIAQRNPLSLPFPIRKRVSLAAVIACPAPWFFLDEPTLGCDASTIAALADLIQKLAEKGHGVIVVSHSEKFVRLLQGIHLKMDGGRILQMSVAE
ncbi:MAG: ATP-binding cassette domain-containing protein [Tepidisphaeraceae bacterium]|jgi:energy-coupling factor transport system ATP-binding protein